MVLWYCSFDRLRVTRHFSVCGYVFTRIRGRLTGGNFGNQLLLHNNEVFWYGRATFHQCFASCPWTAKRVFSSSPLSSPSRCAKSANNTVTSQNLIFPHAPTHGCQIDRINDNFTVHSAFILNDNWCTGLLQMGGCGLGPLKDEQLFPFTPMRTSDVNGTRFEVAASCFDFSSCSLIH